MEGAFSDLWKNTCHRIGSFLGLHFSEAQHIAAICGELTTQEVIHKVNLHKNVDKIERFTDEESKSIEIVTIQVFSEIIQKNFLPFLFRFVIYDGAVEIQDEHFYASTFPCLP